MSRYKIYFYLDSINKPELKWPIKFLPDNTSTGIATRKQIERVRSFRISTVTIAYANLSIYSLLHKGSAGLIAAQTQSYDITNPTEIAIRILEFDSMAFMNPSLKYHFPCHKIQKNGSIFTFDCKWPSIEYPIPILAPDNLTIEIYHIPSLTRLWSSAQHPTTLQFTGTFYAGTTHYDSGTDTINQSGTGTLIGSNIIAVVSNYRYFIPFEGSNQPYSRALTFALSGFTTDDPVGEAAIIAGFNASHKLIPIANTQFTKRFYAFQTPVSLAAATLTINSVQTITFTAPSPPTIGFSVVLDVEAD
jgi:hypothetical protein